MIYRNIVFAVLMTLSYSSFSQEIDSLKNQADSITWKTFAKDSFFISYPSDWILDETGQVGTQFILFSKLDNDADAFAENVNLVIQDISQYKLDLDQYIDISEKQLSKYITNAKVISSQRITDDSGAYHELHYTGQQGIFKLTFLQYIRLKEDIVYISTLTCEQAQFDEYEKTGREILASFELK